MALIKCKECSREISKSAKQCPNCGHDNRNWFGRRNIISKAFIVFFGSIFLIGVLGGLLGGGDSSTSSSTSVQLITNTPKTLLLNIRDIDETGWKVTEEGNDSIEFLKVGGFSAEQIRETITIYPSVDEAIRAYNSEVPPDISIESMNVGDESAMWEEAGGRLGIGVFRVRNAVVNMEYSVSFAAGATLSLESWARKAERKISNY